MKYDAKINIGTQTVWNSHFFGWQPCLDVLQPLHHNLGIKFIGYLDAVAGFEIIKENFIGFFHHVPRSPDTINCAEWSYKLKGLDFYLSTSYWKKNQDKCLGLFCLCDYIKDYLEQNTTNLVCSMPFCFEAQNKFFDYDSYINNSNKYLIYPGNWLRDFESFNRLKSPYQKIITHQSLFLNPDKSVKVLGRLSNVEYENLIIKNIIFQSYYDLAASNTIIECIGKNIPIILNRLPASEEYLGVDYPLFYTSLEEAEFLLRNDSKILDGYNYLKTMNKDKFSLKNFLVKFYESEIYKNLKNPTMI